MTKRRSRETNPSLSIRERVSLSSSVEARFESLRAYEPSGRLYDLLMDDPALDSIWKSKNAIVQQYGADVFSNLARLDHFWKHRAVHNPDLRLTLLRLQVHTGSDVCRKRTIRKQNDQTEGWLCWACVSWEARAWHHIIPIARGGIDDWVNKIPVCGVCHRYIHKATGE